MEKRDEMTVNVKMSINITKSFYCDDCYRNKQDEGPDNYCELYEAPLVREGSKVIKCDTCIKNLLTTLRANVRMK